MPHSAEARALHADRRRRIADAMPGGVMLLASASEQIRTADTHFPFRQDSDFDYVTGFPEPDAIAVIAPGHTEPFALFVRPKDPEREQWVGWRAGVEGAVAEFDAAVAHPIEQFEKEIPRWLAKADEVWLPLARQDVLGRRLLDAVRSAQAQRPRSGSGPHVLHEAGEVLHEMRLFKDPAELALMRATIGIAAEAHREAMRTVRPGMHEYEVEALVDYTFRRRGAAGPAYPSIVAGGANAVVLHYTENAATLGAYDLLLIDAGSERAGYCADITRTFPVGPRFAPAHRDLYDAVLAAQLAAIGAVKPGATLDGLHALTLRVLVEALTHLGLLNGSVDEIVEKETYKRLYMHRTSHWLGRDVHDVGRYKVADVPRPLEPGMVFTIEPGCYVPADADDLPAGFRGTGIRIEDDVLVTATGCEILSKDAPKLAPEIESLREQAFV